MTQQLSAWALMLEGSLWRTGEEANGWERERGLIESDGNEKIR